MAKTTNADAFEQAISQEESGDLSLAMREVMLGVLAELGGPREFGRQLVQLFKSPDTSAQCKVGLGNTFMKGLSLYSGAEGGDDDLLPEELVERFTELEKVKARSKTLNNHA